MYLYVWFPCLLEPSCDYCFWTYVAKSCRITICVELLSFSDHFNTCSSSHFSKRPTTHVRLYETGWLERENRTKWVGVSVTKDTVAPCLSYLSPWSEPCRCLPSIHIRRSSHHAPPFTSGEHKPLTTGRVTEHQLNTFSRISTNFDQILPSNQLQFSDSHSHTFYMSVDFWLDWTCDLSLSVIVKVSQSSWSDADRKRLPYQFL